MAFFHTRYSTKISIFDRFFVSIYFISLKSIKHNCIWSTSPFAGNLRSYLHTDTVWLRHILHIYSINGRRNCRKLELRLKQNLPNTEISNMGKTPRSGKFCFTQGPGSIKINIPETHYYFFPKKFKQIWMTRWVDISSMIGRKQLQYK